MGYTYLATPYTHPDRAIMEERFHHACFVAGQLMREGQVVISPIVHHHPVAVHFDLPRGWEYWEQHDRALLEKADRMLVVKMDGWQESTGIAGELRIAAELGIPVEYLEFSFPTKGNAAGENATSDPTGS